MSADNITYCPKCVRTSGVVPEDVDLSSLSNELRENWGGGMNPDGVFEVAYNCECWKCWFTWEYRFKKKVVT